MLSGRCNQGSGKSIGQGIFNSQVMRREVEGIFLYAEWDFSAEQHYIVCEQQLLNIKTEPFCLVLLPWKMRR